MRPSFHRCIGGALTIVCLICFLLGWSAVSAADFGPFVTARTVAFLAVFGGILLLCGWGALSHFGRARERAARVCSRISEVTFILPASIMGLYVIGYLVLSLQGAYGAFSAGANGVKSYAWYPRGFLDRSGKMQTFAVTVFIPLWFLDNRHWHDDRTR